MIAGAMTTLDRIKITNSDSPIAVFTKVETEDEAPTKSLFSYFAKTVETHRLINSSSEENKCVGVYHGEMNMKAVATELFDAINEAQHVE